MLNKRTMNNDIFQKQRQKDRNTRFPIRMQLFIQHIAIILATCWAVFRLFFFFVSPVVLDYIARYVIDGIKVKTVFVCEILVGRHHVV